MDVDDFHKGPKHHIKRGEGGYDEPEWRLVVPR